MLYSTGICGGSDADSKQIVKQFRASALRSPYLCETNLNAAPDSIFDSIYFCLWHRSAEFLVYDKPDGIVTWCDTGGSFAPLPTDESIDTMEQIESVVTAYRNSYTYGSAMITPLGEQAGALSVFTLGRSIDIDDETFSNGTYEREL